MSLTKKESLADDDYIDACKEMAEGLYDADLGGNVYKKRIAAGAGSRGKSAGYRTIIGANIGDKYFFLYAFAKKAKANINAKEKLSLKSWQRRFLVLLKLKLRSL